MSTLTLCHAYHIFTDLFKGFDCVAQAQDPEHPVRTTVYGSPGQEHAAPCTVPEGSSTISIETLLNKEPYLRPDNDVTEFVLLKPLF